MTNVDRINRAWHLATAIAHIRSVRESPSLKEWHLAEARKRRAKARNILETATMNPDDTLKTPPSSAPPIASDAPTREAGTFAPVVDDKADLDWSADPE